MEVDRLLFYLKWIRMRSDLVLGLFHLSGLTSQFLNGTHEFSDQVPFRMALLMDQFSHYGWPKRREFCGKECTRVPWTFPFKLTRTRSFRPARTDKWKATLVFIDEFFDFIEHSILLVKLRVCISKYLSGCLQFVD